MVASSARFAACTVVTRDRLAAARVLARTYRAQHPGHEFVVLVSDGPGGDLDPAELGLDPDEFLRTATRLSPADLADALRPVLLRTLLDRADVAVLLDADIEVYAPFEDVTASAAEHALVVTPSVLAPLPDDGLEPATVPGVYDGFLAVSRGAQPFLDHWADRARRRDPESAWVWPDLVEGLFEHRVVRDPGLAGGYWNLHERPSAELRFLSFRGYDPETPWLLNSACRTNPRVRLSANPVLRRLCDEHRARLGTTATEPGRFDELPDGTPLTSAMRRLYHDALARTERATHVPDPLGRSVPKPPPHPFGDDAGLAFRQWLTEPASPVDAAGGLTRLAAAVWRGRVDLQAVFPQPYGADGAGFRQWCTTYGLTEGLLPEWALPREPAAPEPPVDDFGVNVVGYLTAELGLGEMARIVQKAISAAGIPMVSVVEEHSVATAVRTTALAAPPTLGSPRFGVSLLTVNSDFTRLLLDSHPQAGFDRYRIGLWAWELEDFPAAMHDGFALVDEVWTPSEFATRAIAAHSPVPVKTIPVPVPDPGPPNRPARAAGEPVRFLYLFDFNSTAGRKNPWGAVTAFQRAFPGREDVGLVIKGTNGHLNTGAVERLRQAIGDDERIELREDYLTVAELDALYAGTDAYVSLHRSEGFGLTVAEAMVRGVPVIATDYSGTTEFFGAESGWPVPYELVDVGPGWPPYHAEGRWAEPDLDAAAAAMRAVADDPAEARRRGEAAREHILRTRSMDVAAAWTREQLEAAHRTWLAGRAAPPARHPLVARVRRALRPVRSAARRLGVAR